MAFVSSEGCLDVTDRTCPVPPGELRPSGRTHRDHPLVTALPSAPLD